MHLRRQWLQRNNYDTIRVSKGTKREPGRVADGSTVHIDDVGADSFFFFGGIDEDYVLFKNITVYFCDSDTYEEILGAKVAIDAAAGENGKCTVCGAEKHYTVTFDLQDYAYLEVLIR